MNNPKINRNDPCPCGSGKKYKQCCQLNATVKTGRENSRLLENIPNLFDAAVKAQSMNDLDKAEELYNQILAINPKHIDTLNNAGLLARSKGQVELAIRLLEYAGRLEPSTKHFNNLGQTLSESNRSKEALSYFRKALTLNPSCFLTHNNIGLLLCEEGNYQDGLPHLYKAIAINSHEYHALYNLARFLMLQGQYIEAARYYRQAIATEPTNEDPYLSYLFCLCFDKDAFPIRYLQEATLYENYLKKRSKPYQSWPRQQHVIKKLRVGFVSGDLRIHPVGYFFESFVQELTQLPIELFAYNTQPKEDELSERIKPCFHKWTNTSAFNDTKAAECIYNDGIDILIDLAGHTRHTGLPLFSWRPAPVQASWLGYFASTGLSFIDYFIADPTSVPAQFQSHFSEKICYLPESRLCFSAPTDSVNVGSLPALTNHFTTFGCFQNFRKINNQVLELWANILKRSPSSKLLLKNAQLNDPYIMSEFLDRLELYNISLDQIIIEKAGTRANYFAAYNKVDFMLDTFPYTGGTTTCDALWMGVPTLTLTGETLLQRQGHSLLHSVGLCDWVANNEEEYVQKTLQFAQNTTLLAQLRQNLRTQMLESPLMDAKRFASNFHLALREMWQQQELG